MSRERLGQDYSEHSEEGNKNRGPLMTRREFLKMRWILGEGISSEDLEEDYSREQTKNPPKPLIREIQTEHGIFYGLYERIHSLHPYILIPENIPPGTKALFVEGTRVYPAENGNINEFTASPEQLFKGNIVVYDRVFRREEVVSFPHETLEYLEENGIPVAFSDIDVTGSTVINAMRLARFEIGLLLWGLSLFLGEEIKSNKEGKRRDFLKKIARLSGFLSGLSLLPPILRGSLYLLMRLDALKSPKQQEILARALSIINIMQPDELNHLFREAVQANKLMLLAEHLGQEVEMPIVVYNYHLGHIGIEYWLRLGRDICRKFILAFPDRVLREVIKANNNDPRHLYAVRLLKVPPSLVNSSPENLSDDDSTDGLSDIIIKDEILAKELEKRRLICEPI